MEQRNRYQVYFQTLLHNLFTLTEFYRHDRRWLTFIWKRFTFDIKQIIIKEIFWKDFFLILMDLIKRMFLVNWGRFLLSLVWILWGCTVFIKQSADEILYCFYADVNVSCDLFWIVEMFGIKVLLVKIWIESIFRLFCNWEQGWCC